MYEAVTQRYPALAKYFLVTDVREPVDSPNVHIRPGRNPAQP